ncbi:MAG: hypothetical protein H6937_02505 [Burkholderiales bacterium]|nr:hypothetical protein [Burkholderiales bacterium]
MTIRVNAFGKTIAFPAGTSPEDIEKHITSNRALLDPDYKEPEKGFLDKANDFRKDFIQNSLGVDIGVDSTPAGVTGLLNSVSRGARQTGRMVGSTVDTVRSNLPGVEQYGEESQQAFEREAPVEQKQLLHELQDIDRDQSVAGQIGDTLSAAGRNKMGTAQLVAEQLPNTAVSLGGGYAGAKTGAAIGSLAGPVGAGAGGILGFLGGMFLGNVLLETGGKAIEKSEGGFTPEEQDETLREGPIKAAVVTGVDTATLGIGGKITKALSGMAKRAGARAEAKVLMDAGVNMATPATINSALSANPALMRAAKVAGEKAALSSLSSSRKAGIAGTGLALETVGEGVGEYLGELAATGEPDVVDATIESLAGMSQSMIETAYNYNKIGSQATEQDVAKAASDINAERTQQGINDIAAAGSVDEAIQAANDTVSQKPITTSDVWDDVNARNDLLRRAEQINQPIGAQNEAQTASTEAPASQTSILNQQTTQESEETGLNQAVIGNGVISNPLQARQENNASNRDIIAQNLSNAPKGKKTEVVLPDNTSLHAEWMVVDADSITASLKNGVNQPRDRTRAVSDIQVQNIAANPDYRRLSDSPVMDVGAPTISADGSIVGGNGRFEGISRAYSQGTANEFLRNLTNDAVNKGIDPATFAGMKKPVLVKRITQPFDIRKLAVASNSGGSLQYSALELARIDSERINNLDRIDIAETGDVALTNKNLSTILNALGGYGNTELAAFVDKDGGLSQEGLKRIKNAVLYSAYGDSPTLSRMVESTDNDMRNIVGALTKVAGDVAKVRSNIKNGAIPKELDITDNLIEAVEKMSQLRSTGMSVDQFMSQQSIFNDIDNTGESKQIMQVLSDTMRSQKKMVEFLRNVYDGISRINVTTDNVFGDTALPTKSEVIENAKPKEQPGLFGTDSETGQADKQKSAAKTDNDAITEESKFSRSPTERLKDRDASIRLERALKNQGFKFRITPKDVRDFAAMDRGRQDEAVTAERLAGIFKKRITWIEAKGEFDINGVMLPSIKDTIFVDVNTDKSAHVVIGHELSHHMEQDVPEVYQAMVDALTEIIPSTTEYAKKYGIKGVKDTYIIKEIVGDIVGDNFADQKFWNMVAAYNPNAFRRIADTVISWLKKLIGSAKLRKLGSEQWVADAQKAQDIVAKAVAKYTNQESTDKTSGIKFSSAGQKSQTAEKNLYVAHNLTAENIRHADEIGGLAAPSLAVAKTGKGFSKFGEITLIAKPDLLKTSKVRTFDSDVYTLRHPRAVHKINQSKYDRFVESLGDVQGLDIPNIEELASDSGIEAITRSPGVQYHWLSTQGKQPAVKPKSIDIDTRKIVKLMKDNGLVREWQAENNENVMRAVNSYIDRKIEEFRGRIKDRLGEAEERNLRRNYKNNILLSASRYIESGGKDLSRLKSEVTEKISRNKKLENEFKVYVLGKFNNLVDEKRIFKGFTPAGKRKYIPYDMDNIIKEMTRTLRAGEDFFYGAGNIRAAFAKEFRNISEIQADRDRIVSPEEMEKIKDDAQNKVANAIEELKPYYRYEKDSINYYSDAAQAIAEGRKGQNEAFNLNDDARKIIDDLVNYLRHLPTEYFEAKAQRPVAFNEFKAAVVPKGSPKDVIDILKNNGLKVQYYIRGDEQSRADSVAKSADKSKVLFSRAESKPNQENIDTKEIPETINIQGVDRPTRNSEGKLIHPTEEGIKNFYAWFGDSKVVDDEGRPRLVYHGSPNDFNVFSFDHMGSQGTTEGQGLYFTPDKQIATGYSRGNKLFEVYLKVTNPYSDKKLTVTKAQIKKTLQNLYNIDPDALSNYGDVEYEGFNSVLNEAVRIESDVNSDADFVGSLINGGIAQLEDVFSAFTKATKKDGIITEWLTPDKSENVEVIVVTNPNQIKSATDNTGKFSAKNDDIRFSRSDGNMSSMKTKRKNPKIAYHGSSGDVFDKFDLFHFGEGEGGGAYGYGIHLTSNSGTASGYGENIYEVEILPKDNELLNWDKPLSKQSSNIRRILEENDVYDFAEDIPNTNTFAVNERQETGADLYERIHDKFNRDENGKKISIGWNQTPDADIKASQYLLSIGIKGIKYKDNVDNVDNFSIFSPDDVIILSNNTKFSRSDTLSQAGVNTEVTDKPSDLPEETKLQAFRRRSQDAMLRFKVVQNWLDKQGVKLSEAANVYQRENISKGKQANKIEDFRRDQLEPLIKRIAETSKAADKEGKFTLGDVATYLEAVHIPEANERMRTIHKNENATANGITDEQARNVLKQFEAMPNFSEFKKLAEEVRKIGTETLDMRLEAGLISQDQYDAYKATYDNWVPLRGNMSEQGFGKGLSTNAKDKRRMGHGFREDEFVLENLIQDRERAIMQIEKNKVGLSVAQFLMEAQNENIGTVDKPEKMRVMKDFSYAVKFKGDVVGSFETESAAKSMVQRVLDKKEKILDGKSFTSTDFSVEKTYDPHITMMARPQLADNEIQVYVNGHAVKLQLNDPGLARAATNAGIEQVGSIAHAARMFNRFLSKAYTAWSPDFLFMNMARDAYSGTLVLTGKKGAKFAAKTFTNYGTAIRELVKGRNDPKRSEWVSRYRAAGGNIGAAYLSDIERVGEDAMAALQEFAGARETYRMVYNEQISKGAKPAKARTMAALKAGVAKTKTAPVVGKMFQTLERVNMVIENALRLATFKTAVESGESDQQAAMLSKDLMNFNRKGEMANQMGALYLFFNPGMQGAHIVGEALFTSPHRKQVWALLGALTTLSFVLAELARGGDDDDREWENTPDYIKDRNLIFNFGDKQVTVPVAYGFGIFHAMGNYLSDLNHGADKSEIAVKLASGVFENFSVFGNPILENDEGNEIRLDQLLPTFPKIIMAPGINLDGLGRQIHPTKYQDSVPDSQLMWRSVRGTAYEDIAHFMNDITGGSQYNPGAIDVSPNTIKYWVTSLTGGAGRFVSDITTGSMNAAEGVEPELENIPVLRKFIREPGVNDSRGAFHKARKEAQSAAERAGKALRNGDMPEYTKMMSELQPIIEIAKYARDAQKMASMARDEVMRIQLDTDMSKAEKKLRIKEIELQEQRVYDQFLSAFDVAKWMVKK